MWHGPFRKHLLRLELTDEQHVHFVELMKILNIHFIFHCPSFENVGNFPTKLPPSTTENNQ